MKKMFATTAVALTLSGITGVGLAAGFASPADAATPTAAIPTAATSTHTTPSHPLRAWLRAHRRALTRHVVEISATEIGITPKALVAELRSGQSIAEVAQAHNIGVQVVTGALVQAGDAQVTKAVTDHRLTSAQGAKIDAALPGAVTKIVNHVSS